MMVLCCIATLSFFICIIFFFTSFFATRGNEKRKHYKKGEATLLRVVAPHRKDDELWYEIAYTVDGVAYKSGVTPETRKASPQKRLWAARCPSVMTPKSRSGSSSRMTPLCAKPWNPGSAPGNAASLGCSFPWRFWYLPSPGMRKVCPGI